MKEIPNWRKNLMKFSGYIFLYMVVIAVIYFTFKYYISESEANFAMGGIILSTGISLIIKIVERYTKNRNVKKLN